MTFDANNSGLRESIRAFGSLTTSPKDDESFVVTDGEESDDGIEIISKEESMSSNDRACDWLFGHSNTLPKPRKFDETVPSSASDESEDVSSWLCVQKSNVRDDTVVSSDSANWLRLASDAADSGRSSPVSSFRLEQQEDDDCARFLLKNLRLDVSDDTRESLDEHQYLHPTVRDARTYEYPTHEFLKSLMCFTIAVCLNTWLRRKLNLPHHTLRMILANGFTVAITARPNNVRLTDVIYLIKIGCILSKTGEIDFLFLFTLCMRLYNVFLVFFSAFWYFVLRPTKR